MAKKSLIGALALTGLVLTGNAYAQNQNSSQYPRTADGILVSEDMHLLNRKEKSSIDSLISGGNVKSIYAMDPIEGIKNILAYLKNNKEKSYTQERINALSKGYQDLIVKLQKEPRGKDYKKSLDNLSLAVSNGMIDPEELREVQEGTYLIVKKGKGKDNKEYSVSALVKIGKEIPDEVVGIPKLKRKETEINFIIPSEPTLNLEPIISTESDELYPGLLRGTGSGDFRKLQGKSAQPESGDLYPNLLRGIGSEDLTSSSDFLKSHGLSPAEEKLLEKAYPKYKGLRLTIDAGIVFDNNIITGIDGEIGLGYNFGNVEIGAKIGAGKTGKVTTESYEGATSEITGRKFIGTKVREEVIRLKAGLEGIVRLFKDVKIIGDAELVCIPTNEKATGQIIGRNGNILKENSSSTSENQINYSGAAGLEINEFRFLVGGEKGKGINFKLGYGFKFPKK
jgi:hypothetical protein